MSNLWVIAMVKASQFPWEWSVGHSDCRSNVVSMGVPAAIITIALLESGTIPSSQETMLNLDKLILSIVSSLK
jgi:hypothetical protein